MSDFDDMYERGLVDISGTPTWDDNDEDNTNHVKYNNSQHYKSNFNINKFQDIILSLTVDLTPISFLNSNQLAARKKLEESYNGNSIVIKHNKNNNTDSLALEVYYNTIFIGYVRKKYKDTNNSSVINDFCFENQETDNISIEYIDHKYYIKKPTAIIQNRFISNKSQHLSSNEKWIIDIWKWIIEYQLETIPLDKNKLLNLETLSINDEIPLETNIFKINKLVSINLVGMNILDLPREILNLNNLKYLNLSDNELSILPSEIEKLKHLEVLDLSHNNLTKLPNEIGTLINLKELIIDHNKLSYIPEQIGNLINLDKMLLHNNKLNSLPESMKNLKWGLVCSSHNNNIEFKKIPKKKYRVYIENITSIVFFIIIAILIFG